MAAPQLLEFTIREQTKGILTFDQALDNSIPVPLSAFSINYGKLPLKSWQYLSTDSIELTFLRNISPADKIFLNYTPPNDINLALRAPVKEDASVATLRRNVVRAFFKVQGKNLIQVDEERSGWNRMANLGQYANGKGYSRRDRGANPRTATPDDFILAYGLREAIQITNIDDADAIQPNTDRLWMAIQDGDALIDSYINQSTKAGKLLVSSNRRRTALILARYYLDTVRRREDILKDYERAIKELDAATTYNPAVRPDADMAINSRAGILRSWRIPQYYNGASGKGFSGWWTDSAGDRVQDYRYDFYNAENNNDDPNWGSGLGGEASNSFLPQQPADDGAVITSGNSVSS
jgi:phage gp36-like protein